MSLAHLEHVRPQLFLRILRPLATLAFRHNVNARGQSDKLCGPGSHVSNKADVSLLKLDIVPY